MSKVYAQVSPRPASHMSHNVAHAARSSSTRTSTLRQAALRLSCAVAAWAILGISPSAQAKPAASATAQAQWKAGQVLMKLAPGADLRTIAARTEVNVSLHRASILEWGVYRMTKPNGGALTQKETAEFITRLAAHPDVLFAEADRIYQALATPNDPAYPSMWHLNAIGAATTWDLTTGTSAQRIGVIDTGTLRGHEDLAAKDIAGYDFIDETASSNDGDGRDADYEDAGDGADCGQGYRADSFHGSHVAGTILAATNNATGIAGINWNAGLVTARALGKCGGAMSDIMEGAAWMAGAAIDGVPPLATEDRVSVMNLSLGGGGPCSNFEQAYIDFINDQGAIMVIAAGNDGGDVNSPGNCSGVITVAASAPGGGLANYSSFGTSVEVVAPGGQMWNNEEQGVLSVTGPGNADYSWQQGTSMASPHVTGAISLLQSLNPDLTFFEIVDLFNATGDACSGCQGKPAMRLDIAAAVVETGMLPEPPPDDAYAGNNSPANAAALGCGTSEEMVMIAGGEDWYSVDAPAGYLLTVDVAAAGNIDLDLYVTTADGSEELGKSTSPTGTEQVRIMAPGGPVLISVLSFDGAQGPYSFGVDCADVDDAFEPNNSQQQAPELLCNTQHDMFMAPGDRDWFTLAVDPTEPFEVTVTTLEVIDLDLYVTTGPTFDDVVAESTTPEGNEFVAFTRGVDTLFAVVTPFQGANGDYTLTLNCPNREPIVEPTPEPEDTPEPEGAVDGEGDGDGDPQLDPNLQDDEGGAWGFGCSAIAVSRTDVPVAMLAPACLLLAAFTRRRRR